MNCGSLVSEKKATVNKKFCLQKIHRIDFKGIFKFEFIEETAIWRARNYGDERLLRKAHEYETPSCTRLNHIFGGG
jgi:hypothetical protein